jgi:hypothetical protein
MDENTTFKLALGTLIMVGITVVGLSTNHKDKQVVRTDKIDSLNHVIDSLQTEIFYLEDGFDHKEHIYEQVIYDCEHGKNHRETLKRLEINE